MDASLREDLNHFLTLFIHWPGWGNDRDQPILTLWELAYETADRDVEANEEEMRLHVWGVLERAGEQRIEVERHTSEIVREFMRVYYSQRHCESGAFYLPHCRTLPFHRACDPKKDPRWSRPPKRQLWEKGRITTYACYPENHPGLGESPWYPSGEIDEYLHREDGPAFTSYFDADCEQVQDEVWWRWGMVHREGGPALIFHDVDGEVRREEWFHEGLLHRADGPAQVFYPAFHRPLGRDGAEDRYSYGWWLEGREMPLSDYLPRVSREVRERLEQRADHYQRAGSYLESRRSTVLQKSVFISFGAPDEAMARRFNDRLKTHGFSTWFFPDDAVPGMKLHRAMSENVHRYDRILFLCSRDSLSRSGVLNELEQTLEREAAEGGSSILVPVRLDDFVFEDWAPPGRADLVRQVRSRVIADFTGIEKDRFKFDAEFSKLARALRDAG